MPGSFRDSAGKLFNSFRRKKKSKAHHNSPIQRLCISTQSLARATSLSSLDQLEEYDHNGTGQSEMYDRYQRGSSCPIPSSGNSQTSLGKPPRHSKDSLSTKEGSGNILFLIPVPVRWSVIECFWNYKTTILIHSSKNVIFIFDCFTVAMSKYSGLIIGIPDKRV